MISMRHITISVFAAPMLFALSACNSSETQPGEAAEADAIAPVAAPAGTQWIDTVTVTESDGYVIGNPDAPIKLVEYASLTCPACAAFAANGIEPLRKDYVNTGRVSYELRNQIHGPHDLALATLVRCGAKESFHPLSDQVWQNLQSVLTPIMENSEQVQQAVTLPPNQRLVKIAEIGKFYDFFAARGISKDQARQCLADEKAYSAIAEHSTKQSEELNVTGTPTFFINGKQIDGNSWSVIEPILQRAGAR